MKPAHLIPIKSGSGFKMKFTRCSLSITLIFIGFSLLGNFAAGAGYSISFYPNYWLCTNVQVTFTGPMVESGFLGDTLQFQYFQYSPDSPSVLNPIFTDPSLTVTSDTVSYWINSIEYASVNFEYMPNIAVRVVDVTAKSNGFPPGQIFFQLTNITPEGAQQCLPTPEFPSYTPICIAIIALCLVLLRKNPAFDKF